MACLLQEDLEANEDDDDGSGDAAEGSDSDEEVADEDEDEAANGRRRTEGGWRSTSGGLADDEDEEVDTEYVRRLAREHARRKVCTQGSLACTSQDLKHKSSLALRARTWHL